MGAFATSEMLRFAVVAALVAVALSVPVTDDFDSFKSQYGKSYATAQEESARRAIFNANLAKIASYQTMEQGSATYGVNEFADLTEDEFRTQRLGFVGGFKCQGPSADLSGLQAAPTSADWRTKGAVTEVKNQGQCGSCWSFSTTGDIEGTHFLATGTLPDLSEQDLVDCDKTDSGCGGGLMDHAMEYVIKSGGLESEKEYPYKAVGGTCQFSKSKVVANISSYECVSPSGEIDEDKLAAYVAANGPTSIAINASPMQFYMGGVSDPLFCSKSKLDHGVLIVGFGTEGSKDYWIIKNSWGPSWGEKGYYRIIRGKGKCGLNTYVVHSKM